MGRAGDPCRPHPGTGGRARRAVSPSNVSPLSDDAVLREWLARNAGGP